MILVLDCESTGLGLHHGCLPYFVSMCMVENDVASTLCFEWDVNPLDRQPYIPQKDRVRIKRLIDQCELFILHNAKFDIRALQRVNCINLTPSLWSKTRCTQLLSHLRNSNQRHALKPLGLKYLDINDDDETDLKHTTQECRRFAKLHFPTWRIAKEGDPHFPTQKSDQEDGMWKNDCWLPRAIVKHCEESGNNYGLPPTTLEHYATVCSLYATRDAERTMGLWLLLKPEQTRVYDGGSVTIESTPIKMVKKKPKPLNR